MVNPKQIAIALTVSTVCITAVCVNTKNPAALKQALLDLAREILVAYISRWF